MYVNIPNKSEGIDFLPEITKIRIADWLISNTMLTEEQISKVTNLDLYTVQKIFNDDVITRHTPLNPISAGYITQEEIDFIPIYEELQKKINLEISYDEDILLKRADIYDLKEKEIFSVKLIKIYFLVRGHNAWWGTWSSLFDNNSSFHTSFASARSLAQTQRTQGRVFTITEVPAICFYTKNGIFVAVNINSHDEPFNLNYNFGTFDEFKHYVSIKEIKESYPQYVFLTYNKNIYFSDIQNDDKFYRYKSYIQSGYMEFDKAEEEFDMRYIKRALNTFKSILKNDT